MSSVPAPIGLRLSQAAQVVSRAFDTALSAVGGTVPVWLVLLNLKTRQITNQRELAEAVGVREPTLTHHLNAMDAQGLITRRRNPSNRRIHVVEITGAGETAFLRLRTAAIDFDRRLRAGFTEAELDTLGNLLGRLTGNAGSTDDGTPPSAGLAGATPEPARRRPRRPAEPETADQS
ncbi:MAG TPA: MarR family winged helix-turn-helix transcriptional regulator [Streptosporangiaceae bacterium]|nr:MarR family winged helix-turn-helix transcriptional regulator [Streptosporangiaceae bacterium]